MNQGQLALLQKAEIDSQIATAHAFPRSLAKSLTRMISMATLTVEIAESCEYALPRGDKVLNGPSIRLAEIVFSQYGNIRGGARTIYNDGKKVVGQGIVHDLETNALMTMETSRSIQQHEWIPDPQNPGKRKKSGRMVTMTEDMQVVTGNASAAIAFRNAVFKVIPGAIVQTVYQKAREVARGSLETLVVRRSKALDYLHALGVDDERICSALVLQSVDDIDLDKLAIIRGMCNRIRDNISTVEELFPKPSKKTDPAATGSRVTSAAVEALNKTKANTARQRKKPADKKEKAASPAPATPPPAADEPGKVTPK